MGATDTNFCGYSELFIAEATAPSEKAGTYFLCSKSYHNVACKKRWNLYSEQVLESHGFGLVDFQHLYWSDQELGEYDYQGYLPMGLNCSDRFRNSDDPVLFRLWLGSLLKGKGLEFGAGANPFPVAMSSFTIYADRFSMESLSNSAYPGQEVNCFVAPHVIADMSDLSAFGSNSFDYIVASHVIEHLSDPINAIVESHRILKKGGRLLLAVPSKDRTFDKSRPCTPLAHLVDDYERYDRARDLSHYREWFSLVQPSNSNDDKMVNEAWECNADIHYHTWTVETFIQLMNHIKVSYAQFSHSEIFPEVNPDSIEFYACFLK
jgi:predicted SAM-dependent methyltransferase